MQEISGLFFVYGSRKFAKSVLSFASGQLLFLYFVYRNAVGQKGTVCCAVFTGNFSAFRFDVIDGAAEEGQFV